MRRNAFGLLVLLGLGCAVLGVGYIYFMSFSPDRDVYPIRGIDVSNHQGLIDWRRVAADDVAFAMIKATEGGDWIDKSFARNFAAAKEAGLAIGPYHFFTFCRPGADQARNFIAHGFCSFDFVPRTREVAMRFRCYVPRKGQPPELLELYMLPGELGAARDDWVPIAEQVVAICQEIYLQFGLENAGPVAERVVYRPDLPPGSRST